MTPPRTYDDRNAEMMLGIIGSNAIDRPGRRGHDPALQFIIRRFLPMNVYEIKSMRERLDGNTYPGRGIVLGITPDGKKAAAA